MKILHDSDCALHNAPALPALKCDCGAGELPRIIRQLKAALSAAPNRPLKLKHADARGLLSALEEGATLLARLNDAEMSLAVYDDGHSSEYWLRYPARANGFTDTSSPGEKA